MEGEMATAETLRALRRAYEAAHRTGDPEVVRRALDRFARAAFSSTFRDLDASGTTVYLWSSVLGETVAWVPVNCPSARLEEIRKDNMVPYTYAELEALAGCTAGDLRVIHRLKKEFGGTVVEGMEELTLVPATPTGPRPGPADERTPAKAEPVPGPVVPVRLPVPRDDPARVKAIALALKSLSNRIRACRDCPLHATRTNAVPGEGSVLARVVFVGEAPGAYEDATGRPFVGRAGMVLERLLKKIGFRRKQVFIANTLKCRPPSNREPEPEETEACRKYLRQQLALLSPDLVVTLGRTALQWFLPGRSVMSLRGEAVTAGGYRLYPTLHPAATLYKPELRDLLEEDFARIPQILEA